MRGALAAVGGYLGGMCTCAALYVGWYPAAPQDSGVPNGNSGNSGMNGSGWGQSAEARAQQDPGISLVSGNHTAAFSMPEVVRQLAEATDRQAHSTGPGALAFEHRSQRLEDYYRISVYAEGGAVRLVFQSGGKAGLDVAREFFESPLFTPEDTRMLYGLMNRAKSGPHDVSQRFEASASLTRRGDMLIFVLRLVPRG